MSMKLTRENYIYCCTGRSDDPKYFRCWVRNMMH